MENINLTDVEFNVLACMAFYQSGQEIAEISNISLQEFNINLCNILRKTNLQRQNQLRELVKQSNKRTIIENHSLLLIRYYLDRILK